MAPEAEDANTPNSLFNAHLRIARATKAIEPLLQFYRDGLGFRIIGSFNGHNGFDGVMLGHSSLPYHLEFTTQPGHDPGRAASKENLLVFYLPDRKAWETAIARMERYNCEPIENVNPYWNDAKGKTYEDCDGYRVVLWNGGWKPFEGSLVHDQGVALIAHE
ncbi:hypothetical protein ACN47E_009587 [Coniothyrium glycines]